MVPFVSLRIVQALPATVSVCSTTCSNRGISKWVADQTEFAPLLQEAAVATNLGRPIDPEPTLHQLCGRTHFKRPVRIGFKPRPEFCQLVTLWLDASLKLKHSNGL